ncbi:hypothetical protein NPX13_g6945 [Xylaria arbuscula]|uniref:Uncharacterized protein n=1 Tax=Xylaria arbuscula TaxID=114810 RepID=A0A9W8TLN4_9PEZI|nr:hypothetical protein NPX13_g6945 [Xylaria arbuscula]
MYHFLLAFSAVVSRTMFTRPNRSLTGLSSDNLTRLVRGLAMKLIVLISNRKSFLLWSRTYFMVASTVCTAKGGTRILTKVTKGEVIYATNATGATAQKAAAIIWRQAFFLVIGWRDDEAKEGEDEQRGQLHPGDQGDFESAGVV